MDLLLQPLYWILSKSVSPVCYRAHQGGCSRCPGDMNGRRVGVDFLARNVSDPTLLERMRRARRRRGGV